MINFTQRFEHQAFSEHIYFLGALLSRTRFRRNYLAFFEAHRNNVGGNFSGSTAIMNTDIF